MNIEKAINIMKHKKPKTEIIECGSDAIVNSYCPSCNKRLWSENYCSNCGQKIDWWQ